MIGFAKSIATIAAACSLLTLGRVDAKPAILKVMSFNLRTTNARDPCPNGCWEQRKWRAKEMLARYVPDLIGTQEGAPIQIDFFTKDLGYASHGECAGNCEGNERNSIFYKTERWELIEGSTFALSDTPDIIGSNTWNLEYLRAAVWGRFRDRWTDNIVCMFNTHYDISRGQSQSSLLVASRIQRHCKPQDTLVFTGDMNTELNTQAIQYLLGNAVINKQKAPIPLYEALIAGGAGGPTWIGGSFGDKTTGGKIDYVFARHDPHTCLINGKIILDTFGGYTVSDHAVVQAEFGIGRECQDLSGNAFPNPTNQTDNVLNNADVELYIHG
jgi:endonuclease/exonuclease/phosphatase family metal-dependent hydrolase